MSQSLTELYKLFEKLKGPSAARETVETTVSLAIWEIQEEGLEVTAEELEKRVIESCEDFLEVARKTNVA